MLQAGTMWDATVWRTAPNTGPTAVAKTAGQNQADGVSEFVAASAASALGSWVGWFLVKFLWAPSPLCSPVPVEEGTA